ncbi:MAG: hypothetical protein GY810_04230 [Aureispira sp.]|nr:hypothetical protein [Aureispira sp.]
MKTTLKLVFFSFLSLCFVHKIGAQAIHDAFALREMMGTEGSTIKEGSNSAAVYKILAQNMSSKETGVTYTDIVIAYAQNPFIGPYLSEDMGGPTVYSGTTGQRSLAGLAGASTGLGLPASTFLLGLTDFLVKRTKQELTIAFFRDFQKIVSESDEMKYLFPSTTKVLLKIGEDIYQFKAFWEVLRESFLKDLENLVYHLDDYIQNSKRIESLSIKYMMSDFFKIIELFYEQTTPAEVIHYLSEDAYLHNLTPLDDTAKFIPVIQSSFKILGLLSESIEDADKNGYWADPRLISKMLKDTITRDLYLGLVYEKGKEIAVGEQTLGDHLASLRGHSVRCRAFINKLFTFIEKGRKLKRVADGMRRRDLERKRSKGANPVTEAEKEMEYDEYFDFTQGICEMALYAYDFKKELLGSSNNEDSLVYKYIGIIHDLNSMGLSIRKQHFTSALISSLFIIEKLLPEGKFHCERKILMKYGTFIATAVNAKTAAEVSDAIAAFALPPGGSAIKKYSKFSIALNAYVGLSAGQEVLKNIGPKTYYAVTTPIGVSFNWGFKNYGAIGIMASVFDIGALTSFRFQDDSVNELPDLKFENVLAPGGYLVYNLPKYPLSLGVGAQLGPNLRSVKDNNLNISTTSGWRWGAFLAVDIPMVSIFTTNKNYKQCCKKCNKKKKAEF